MRPRGQIFLPFLVLLWGWLLAGCARGSAEPAPPEIRYGEDICQECQMIISDPRFAAGYAYEIGPGRYQSLAFDDIGDMLAHAARHPEHAVVAWYVHDYHSQEWLDATQAIYVRSSALHTPMGHGLAAFADPAAAQALAAERGGTVLTWEELTADSAHGEMQGSDDTVHTQQDEQRK
jgi:copper chaperone NosL